MAILAEYLRQCGQIHGVGTPETSFYPALQALFTAVGAEMKPKVVAIMNPAGTGGNLPDGSLYPANHLPRPGQAGLPFPEYDPTQRKPERGVIEVKGIDQNLDQLIQSDQVRRYLLTYGQVLCTNLRQFALVQIENGAVREVERFSLAETALGFWDLAHRPTEAEGNKGKLLAEFLTRVFLAKTTLSLPKDVADYLASYAREARQRIDLVDDLLQLTALKEAMEKGLGVQFEGEKGDDFFRSSLVQTLFYGVFSAWVLWHEQNPTRTDKFDWEKTYRFLSIPVLEGLFRAGSGRNIIDQTRVEESLRNAGEVLNRVDRTAFFLAFESATAVQYFYEPFLASFDPELRKQLGVWYTPPEIVRYMVRKVDTVLREDLGIADGLAGDEVIVLDPCCGTGAYLVECLRVIAERLAERDGPHLIGDRLRKIVTERLFGFELLPGPFVIAHLQLGFLLAKHGVALTLDQRAGVYLTNALTGWSPASEPPQLTLDTLGLIKESADARRVKQDDPVLAVIGNPPYNGYAGIAHIDEERDIADLYRPEVARGQGINDLYVRFFALADRRITRTGRGVVCYISNYSWLEGLSFAKMRESYLSRFTRIDIDNLNGDKYATGKRTPDGQSDPSAFSTSTNPVGIQVGTAIATLVRSSLESPVVRYRDYWGVTKLARLELNEGDEYVVLSPPQGLGYPFKPRSVSSAYLSWPTLPELFPISFPGVKTSRDDLVVAIDEDRLRTKMAAYFDLNVSEPDLGRLAPSAIKSSDRFNARQVRHQLAMRGINHSGFQRFAYRPFDTRWIYFEVETDLIDRRRAEMQPHVFSGNLWLAACPNQRRGFDVPNISGQTGSLHLIERGALLHPLRLRSLGAESNLFGTEGDDRETWNLTDRIWSWLADIGYTDCPESVFFHSASILHAPQYALENADALRQDWPRLPLPTGPDAREIMLNGLTLGKRVAALLEPETDAVGVTSGTIEPRYQAIAKWEPTRLPANKALEVRWGFHGQGGVTMPGGGKTVERGDGGLDIVMNDHAAWLNVPQAVWNYHLGGYQVLKKWLSYRQVDLLGRPMRDDEILEFTRIARRIQALLDLGPKLDAHYQRSAEAARPV